MNVESHMATRTTETQGRKPGETHTEFQLHKSQNLVSGSKKNIVDYSEHRLLLFIEQATDEQQKLTLKEVLAKYKKGLVAVAWKSGKPVWLNVTKETRRN